MASNYQETLVSSIETCGRTLLDTIDHVLDFAKINKLQSPASRRKGRGSRKSPADNPILGVVSDFDLAQLAEEVCDTVNSRNLYNNLSVLTYRRFVLAIPSVRPKTQMEVPSTTKPRTKQKTTPEATDLAKLDVTRTVRSLCL